MIVFVSWCIDHSLFFLGESEKDVELYFSYTKHIEFEGLPCNKSVLQNLDIATVNEPFSSWHICHVQNFKGGGSY